MQTVPRSTATFALCSLLTIAAAAAPAFAFANDEHKDAQSSDQPVSDTWITTKVKAELATTDGVKSMDLSVKTVNGVVTLTGTQPTQAAIKAAVATTQKIKGVQRVDADGVTVRAAAAGDRP